MLDEKKKINVQNWRLQGVLNNGGEVSFEDEAEPIPGIDAPYTGDTGFLGG
jgi:hypothetical protein